MKKILIIERDQEMRRRLNMAFASAGYQVHSAEGAEDAINLIRDCSSSEYIDLVILDISEGRQPEVMMVVQQRQIPVFTVMNSADKQLIIEMLGRKRTDFIERFIETQKVVLYNGTSGSIEACSI
jgi:DNA-binding NtrC family response regulator